MKQLRTITIHCEVASAELACDQDRLRSYLASSTKRVQQSIGSLLSSGITSGSFHYGDDAEESIHIEWQIESKDLLDKPRPANAVLLYWSSENDQIIEQ